MTAARVAAFAKPVAGPSGGVGGTLTPDPGANAASAKASDAPQSTGEEQGDEDADADDDAIQAALGGVAPTGVPAAPSPLLATLMRTRDVQAPVTPTLVTAIGGKKVTNLDQLAAVAKAAAASTSVAFSGIHSGKGSFMMVDTMELGPSPAPVKEYVYDRATLQWRPNAGGGGSAVDAVSDAASSSSASSTTTTPLPSDVSDIVQRTPKARRPAGGKSTQKATRASAVSSSPSAVASAPSADAPLSKSAGAILQPVDKGTDAMMAAVDGDDDTAVPSSLSSLPPASLAAWLALAAKAKGRVPVHASQTWNASQIAAFKKQAVTITIYEWFPLEHNVAASKATGSGFVVDAKQGIIATNAHVAGATVGGWEVLFFDGSTAPVRF